MRFESIDRDLCNYCGTCVFVCPVKAIGLGKEKAELVGHCISCGRCFNSCPGISVPLKSLSQEFVGKYNDPELGHHRRIMIARSKDRDVLGSAASGGFVTSLLVYMLEKRMVDKVLLVGMDEKEPWRFKVRVVSKKQELLDCRGSKYSLVPLNSALEKRGRIAVVGLPCHIHGIRLLQRNGEIGRDAFLIGLFCGFNMSIKATEFLLKKCGIKKSEVKRLEYRGGGWPGGFHVKSPGKDIFLPKSIYNFLSPAFVPDRCLACPDLTSELADISVGDCWIEGKERFSTVIVRTSKAEKVLKLASGSFHTEEISRDDLLKTHGHLIRYKKRGIALRMKKAPLFDFELVKPSAEELKKEKNLYRIIRIMRSPLGKLILRILPLNVLDWISRKARKAVG